MGIKLIFLFRIMILRTAATRFEFELDWLDLFCFFIFLDVRIDRRSVCDSEDKDV